MTNSVNVDGIKVFFEPQSVAVFGASTKTTDKWGNRLLNNLLHGGYQGKVFAIHPDAPEINGVKAYPSLADIPEAVELAVLAVPARVVTQAMEDCARKRVKGVAIVASGFSEAGEEGAKRQQEVVQIAARAGIRVIGPNTTGTLDPYTGFTTTGAPTDNMRSGSVAFVAQTGIFAGLLLDNIASSQNFGLSKIAGLGNKCDVCDHEILDYLAQDERTRVVIMYIEGIKKGRLFLESARRISRKKPVIVLKGGRTEGGAKAALSHTGSLVGKDNVVDALFRQAGIIRVNDVDELMDCAKMFALQPLPQGNRLAIITPSGGAGVVAADASSDFGLALATLQPETLQKIQEKLPEFARAGHPIDLAPLSEANGFDVAYPLSVTAALSDPNVDMVLLIASTQRFTPGAVDFFCNVRSMTDKPLAICLMGHKEVYDRLYPTFEQAGTPVFPYIRRAVSGLAALYKYQRFVSA